MQVLRVPDDAPLVDEPTDPPFLLPAPSGWLVSKRSVGRAPTMPLAAK